MLDVHTAGCQLSLNKTGWKRNIVTVKHTTSGMESFNNW